MRLSLLRNVSRAALGAALFWTTASHAADLSLKASLGDLIDKESPALLEIYKDLHAHPEPAFREVRTAAFLAGELRKVGFEVTEKVGNTGIVAVLRNGAGPTILLRGDMDALPVLEKTNLPFASKDVVKDLAGKDQPMMHACSHDMHVTNLIGTARLLVALKDHWSGTVVIMGQPAEEIVAGAHAMLSDGLFTRFPKPDMALALHVHGGFPAGQIGYGEGPFYANVSSVDISVPGVGTHGSTPQDGRDPIVLGAHIVVALQTIVSREITPGKPAVVTVGSFHGGSKHNIISDEVKMQLTLRTYDDQIMEHLVASIRRICEGEAKALGMPANKMPVVTVTPEHTPATVNTPELSNRLGKAFQTWFGNVKAHTTPAIMGAEDFGLLGRTAEKVPICIWRVGATKQEDLDAAAKENRSVPSNHSPLYAPDPEPTLKGCLESMTVAVLELAPKK